MPAGKPKPEVIPDVGNNEIQDVPAFNYQKLIEYATEKNMENLRLQAVAETAKDVLKRMNQVAVLDTKIQAAEKKLAEVNQEISESSGKAEREVKTRIETLEKNHQAALEAVKSEIRQKNEELARLDQEVVKSHEGLKSAKEQHANFLRTSAKEAGERKALIEELKAEEQSVKDRLKSFLGR